VQYAVLLFQLSQAVVAALPCRLSRTGLCAVSSVGTGCDCRRCSRLRACICTLLIISGTQAPWFRRRVHGT